MTRLLTILGVLLALGTIAMAGGMVLPLWNKVGLMGAAVLFFPLHILVLTVVALLLGRVAARRQARVAANLFRLTAVLTICMAILPVLSNWRTARRLSVPLS